MMHDFASLCCLIQEDKLPLHNIALTLLLEVARWYSLETTTQMFYSSQTMVFWRVIYKLLLSGDKSVSEYQSDQTTVSSSTNPQSSNINFAVPNVHSIRTFKGVPSLPSELRPGIIDHGLELKSGTSSSFVLSVDGKKVAAGLTDKWGDIDLFGHEPVPLDEVRSRMEKELKEVQKLDTLLGNSDIKDSQEVNMTEILKQIATLVKVISLHIQDLRQTKLNQVFGHRGSSGPTISVASNMGSSGPTISVASNMG